MAKYGLVETSFSSYASFLLNSGAGGGSENKGTFSCVSTLLQFQERQHAKFIEAVSLELTGSKEALRKQIAQILNECEKRVNDVNITSEGQIRELGCQLQDHAKQHSAAELQLRKNLNTSQLELQECKAEAQNRNATLESKLRDSLQARKASDQEVERLKSSVQEKDRALEKLKVETDHVTCKLQKVETQLAQIEQKAAQDSLASGSYADGHANPSMEDACKSADRAIDNLVSALHTKSITSKSSLVPEDHMDRVISQISPARMANFSRPVQLKYVWGCWICFRMFHGFEHVFFDMDDLTRSSPLDPKAHSSNCFQSFEQTKPMPSPKLYEECHLFRAFCVRKYPMLFPFNLVKQALYPECTNIQYDSYGRFSDDHEIYKLFLDVAKEIWLLHLLPFSFDPPADILRMAPGLPFEARYHESVIHDVDSDMKHQQVLLMIRPGFRLRNTIIRSRVFLSPSGCANFSKNT